MIFDIKKSYCVMINFFSMIYSFFLLSWWQARPFWQRGLPPPLTPCWVGVFLWHTTIFQPYYSIPILTWPNLTYFLLPSPNLSFQSPLEVCSGCWELDFVCFTLNPSKTHKTKPYHTGHFFHGIWLFHYKYSLEILILRGRNK